MKLNFFNALVGCAFAVVLASCASMTKSGPMCTAGDAFCASVRTALDKAKTCDAKDSVCDAARKAIVGGKGITGLGPNDELGISFMQGMGKNACFKGDPKCDSVKMAMTADKECGEKDADCKSLRAAGFSQAAVDEFNKK